MEGMYKIENIKKYRCSFSHLEFESFDRRDNSRVSNLGIRTYYSAFRSTAEVLECSTRDGDLRVNGCQMNGQIISHV
jgi:hypothetical protein